MEIRRPWEPTDDVVVYVGEALETISAEQWAALDFWMGYLAASAYRHPDPAKQTEAGVYLGLVGKLRDDLVKGALPEARKLAKLEFDPRKLLRMEALAAASEDSSESDEPTLEELREAAKRTARAEAPPPHPVQTGRKK